MAEEIEQESVTVKVEIPMVPNFLRAVGRDITLPVGDMTDEGLRKLGERWTENLIERAREQRKSGA